MMAHAKANLSIVTTAPDIFMRFLLTDRYFIGLYLKIRKDDFWQ